MKEKASAKINLHLDVLGKRVDGFHNLQTLMSSVEYGDVIKVDSIKRVKSNGGKLLLALKGKHKSDVSDDESNILFKAFYAFFENLSYSAEMSLTLIKNIPVGAGLAGGSSDAAALLRVLNRIFKEYSKKQLIRKAVQIGADVPFCLQKKMAVCTGLGDKIRNVRYKPNLWCVIVKPDFSVNTSQAYKNVKVSNEDEKSLSWFRKVLIQNRFQMFYNSFEESEFQNNVELLNIKKSFIKNGSIHAIMSGSGSSIVGIFNSVVEAKKCFFYFEKSNDYEVILTRCI